MPNYNNKFSSSPTGLPSKNGGEDKDTIHKHINGAIGRILGLLQKEYVIMGKIRVQAWHAWLLIGLMAGITAGMILVANRSGELEKGQAVVSSSFIPPGMRLCGSNPNRQVLCSDTRNLFGGYGKEIGLQYDGSTHIQVNLCYGIGCSAPRCTSSTSTPCVEVSPAFFAERAKYQGIGFFSGKGSGLALGMKSESPYMRILDYARITTMNNGANLDNNAAEKY